MRVENFLKGAVTAVLLPWAAGAVEVDGIAAQVGAATILRSDVVTEMRHRGLPDNSRFNEVRNQLIERQLILKAASESKMTMQEWVIENRIREIIAKSFDGDRSKLIETLGQQKVSYPEWRSRMKDDMIVGAMRWNVVDKNVTASPAEMRKEFDTHPERYTSDHKVSVSVIMLKPEDSVRRKEISEKLKDTDFAALGGKKYEKIVPEDVFNEEVCKEIAAMPKGTVSHWLEIDGWSFLIRKDDETSGRKRAFEEAYDDIEANVKEARAKQLYTEWMQRLRAETYIKVF